MTTPMRSTDHVNVAEYRDRTDALLDVVRRDWPACVNWQERKRCREHMQRAMSDLAHARAKRLSDRDAKRALNALESARAILAVDLGPEGHRVKEEDRERITRETGCARMGCDATVTWCDHSRFVGPNGPSIAFYYVCEEHRKKGET